MQQGQVLQQHVAATEHNILAHTRRRVLACVVLKLVHAPATIH